MMQHWAVLIRFAKALVMAGAVVLLADGCALTRNSPRPMAHYELRIPVLPTAAAQAAPVSIAIGRFGALGPHGTRMLYRKGPHQVARDEYNRWVLPPNELVAREFYRGFAASGAFHQVISRTRDNDALQLTGTLIELEATVDLRAHVRVDIVLTNPQSSQAPVSREYSDKEPFSPASPEAFAAAASEALGRIVAAAVDDVAAVARQRPGPRPRPAAQ